MRTVISIFVLSGLLFLPEFAFSAKIKSHWKNPSANETSLQFSKVLVLVPINHELTRKVAEDKIVRIIMEGGRAQAIPSYSALQISELEDKEKAKSKIQEMGFDGVIVLRYSSADEASKYNETRDWGTYNYFWGDYYPVFTSLYSNTESSDVMLYVETMLYSLKDEKLIWTGITETKNPKNPAKVVGEIAEETTKYLQKEGLIAPKKK